MTVTYIDQVVGVELEVTQLIEVCDEKQMVAAAREYSKKIKTIDDVKRFIKDDEDFLVHFKYELSLLSDGPFSYFRFFHDIYSRETADKCMVFGILLSSKEVSCIDGTYNFDIAQLQTASDQVTAWINQHEQLKGKKPKLYLLPDDCSCCS